MNGIDHYVKYHDECLNIILKVNEIITFMWFFNYIGILTMANTQAHILMYHIYSSVIRWSIQTIYRLAQFSVKKCKILQPKTLPR